MVEQMLATPCAYVPRTEGFRPLIYGLVDPAEPAHVRYVGMAMRVNRPFAHAKNARKMHSDFSHKTNWIRKIQSEGRQPSILVLEELSEGACRSFVGEIEKMYIASLRRIGHRLTNVSDGGDGGMFGHKSSDATRAKQSAAHMGNTSALGTTHETSEQARKNLSKALLGRKLSAAHCKSISEAKIGVLATPEARANISAAALGRKDAPETVERKRQAALGRKHTDETKELLRQQHLGKPASAETKAILSASHLGLIHTLETRKLQSASQRARWEKRKADALLDDSIKVGRTPSKEERVRLSEIRRVWWAAKKAEASK